MKNTIQKVALDAKLVSLRAGNAFGGTPEVDEAAGIIRNVAVMHIGEAQGHGFWLDSSSLEQLRDLINGCENGVIMRFQHPRISDADPLGTDVGRLKNARIVGDAVRGDVHLAAYAKSLPMLGDVYSYLLAKAKEDPSSFGLSAVIGAEIQPQMSAGGVEKLVARINQCCYVDFVASPAANPDGLLSKRITNEPKQVQKRLETPMDSNLKQVLINDFRLDPAADDAAAQAVYDSLTPEQQATCQQKASAMTQQMSKPAAPAAPVVLTTVPVVDKDDQMIALETKRIDHIAKLGKLLKVDDDHIQLCVSENKSLEESRVSMLEWLATNRKAVQIRVGDDVNRTSLSAAIPDAIQLRAGLTNFYEFTPDGSVARGQNGMPVARKPHERATQLRHLSLLGMFQQHMISLGIDAQKVMYFPPTKLAELLGPRAFRREFPNIALAQGTSDFDNILADTMRKSLRQAYIEKASTWQNWARRATTPDFKTVTRAQVSDIGSLQTRLEGGEYKQVTISDSKETYTLVEYGSVVRLTRRAIINDDLNAFNRIATYHAAAAKRKEDDVAYAILTANAAMSDTVALFHGTHANLVSVTASVGAPTITTLQGSRLLMRVQTGPKGSKLNLIPRILLVPAALEAVAEQYTSANYVAAIQTSINPFGANGSTPLRVVVEPRLDSTSATVWYLIADYNEIDTVEVCFLEGEQEPVLKQETDFDTDDQKFACRHTVAAGAIDFRGMVKNPGA